jgi:thiosulfate dehydrogenase
MLPARALFLVLAGPAAAGPLALPPHDYGRQLVSETYALIGPEVADPAMRYAGNNLACANCHLDAGTRAHGLSLVGVVAKYPKALPDGGSESIEDRINGCMTRSMNGRPLPETGREMHAVVAYLDALAAVPGSWDNPAEDPDALPSHKPDATRGQALYLAQCAACHRPDGSGMRNGRPGDAQGYLHPPLWGADSFNAAAGMGRVETVAAFIHANMPLGSSQSAPVLTPEQAWDIAAFIDTRPRPPAPLPNR